MRVHGASTAKVDLPATWTDPVDDLVADPGSQTFSAAVDEIPLPDLRPRVAGWTDDVLRTHGDLRPVGFYDREHDLVAMAPQGSDLGLLPEGAHLYEDTAPPTSGAALSPVRCWCVTAGCRPRWCSR